MAAILPAPRKKDATPVLAPFRPNHVWALDFQFDETADGRILKLLHVVDEFTREALAVRCERRIDADETVARLERLVVERGRSPQYVRCDNGPELTANALRDWCRLSRTGASYIEPGSPWQNPYVESFGSRIRDELLAVEQFSCLAEARVMVAHWRHDYNHHRPHSGLGMTPPARFAAAWRPEPGQPDTRGTTPEPRSKPHNTSILTGTSLETANLPPEAAGAVSLQSPYGLPPRDGSTTVPPTTNPRLPLRVDQ